MALCTSCGTDNPERAKFCLECGAALAVGEARSAGSRKLVTVLFADVVGSTALGAQLDPETMRAALARYFTAARTVLERHGGTVEKFVGDAVMAVFGVPVLHEDDALRAVRAALELRSEIGRLNDQLSAERHIRVEFRIGVNSGMVVAGGGDASGSFVTGDAVNVAARLEQAAGSSEILIGDGTYRLVRDFVQAEASQTIAAKGKADELTAYRLVGLTSGAAGAATAFERRSPFVGRRRELSRLRETFDDATADRRCFLFTLLGSAGVGKSRLVAEFLDATAGEATLLRGRCLPYGDGITYWPIGEMVRGAIGVADDADAASIQSAIGGVAAGDASAGRVADLLTSMLGLTTVNSPAEERVWAVRRFLEACARERPLVCLIEDIHWAEPALLDLVENVADLTRDAPILLLCTARPELLESRPTWGGGKVNATTILLEPLNSDATRQLVDALVSQAGLVPRLVDRILSIAEGNPLFAEEIVRMLGENVDAAAQAEQVQIPTSVQAVIAARLDRLPATERAVAERAAVAGRVFERGAVLELMREDERERVPTALLALMRKELVQPSQPDMTPDEAFRFRHMLIRDTAYEGLAKQERADLHERFAGWVERVSADRVEEYEEIIGYHLELAQQYRRELGLDDEQSANLAQRAGERLSGAGRRAYLRGERSAATALLQKAIELLPATEKRRTAMIWLCLSVDRQEWRLLLQTAERLVEEGTAAGDEAAALKGWLLSMHPRMFSDPTFEPSTELENVVAARRRFEALNDEHGMALAEEILQSIYLSLGHWEDSRAAAERGLAHATAAGDPRLVETMRFWIVNASLWGPLPVPQVLQVTDEMVDAVESPAMRANLIGQRALAHAYNGDADAARADTAEAIRIKRELGDPQLAWSFAAAPAEAVLGDLEASNRTIHWNIEVLARMDETGQRSTMYGFLARNLFEQGAPDADVIAAAEQCRHFAAVDDMVSQLQWRAALALVAARGGRIDEAKRYLAEAEQINQSGMDFVWEMGLTALDAGYVHQQAGEREDAAREYEKALAYFEQKGDVMDAARARERLAGLGGG